VKKPKQKETIVWQLWHKKLKALVSFGEKTKTDLLFILLDFL